MGNASAALLSEFAALELAGRHFPMWRDWGVEDESVAVHSLGLTYLTTIGQTNGYACCCEYPVAGHKVRADSVWWEQSTRHAVALFEFERHKGGSELTDKVKNLVRAYHHLGAKAELLGLVFWTKNFYPLGTEVLRGLWTVLERGFETDEREHVPPAPTRLLRVFECLHEPRADGRHVLKSVVERKRP